MNAYVLLPNAAHLLLQAPDFDYEKHIGASREAIEVALKPLLEAKPNTIADYLASIPQEQRNILHRCLLTCLRALDEYAFEQRLGLPKEVSGEVLELLAEASKKNHA